MVSETMATIILGAAASNRIYVPTVNIIKGREINLKREYGITPFGVERIAPWGNRTYFKYPETTKLITFLPHYHRTGKTKLNGEPLPGQNKNRHRPWESHKDDKKFTDRF